MNIFKKSIIHTSLLLALIVGSTTSILTLEDIPEKYLAWIVRNSRTSHLENALKGRRISAWSHSNNKPHRYNTKKYNKLAPDATLLQHWVDAKSDSMINGILKYGSDSRRKKELINTILDHFAIEPNRRDFLRGVNADFRKFKTLLGFPSPNSKIQDVYQPLRQQQPPMLAAKYNLKNTTLMLAIKEATKARSNYEYNDYMTIITWLITAGADITEQSNPTLVPGSLDGRYFTVTEERGKIKVKVPSRKTPFTFAAIMSEAEPNIVIPFINALIEGRNSLPGNRNPVIIPNNQLNYGPENIANKLTLLKDAIHYAISKGNENIFNAIINQLIQYKENGTLNVGDINRYVINAPAQDTERDLMLLILRSTQGAAEKGGTRMDPAKSVRMIKKLLENFNVDLFNFDKFAANALYWAIRGLQPEILEAIIKYAPNEDLLIAPLTASFGGLEGSINRRPIELASRILTTPNYNGYYDVSREDWKNDQYWDNFYSRPKPRAETRVEDTMRKLLTTKKNDQTLLQRVRAKVNTIINEADTLEQSIDADIEFSGNHRKIASFIMELPNKINEAKRSLNKLKEKYGDQSTLQNRKEQDLSLEELESYELINNSLANIRENLGIRNEDIAIIDETKNNIQEIRQQISILERKIEQLEELGPKKLLERKNIDMQYALSEFAKINKKIESIQRSIANQNISPMVLNKYMVWLLRILKKIKSCERVIGFYKQQNLNMNKETEEMQKVVKSIKKLIESIVSILPTQNEKRKASQIQWEKNMNEEIEEYGAE